MTSRVFALIPAAGTGTRTGAAIPKQYLDIAGEPMIARTIAAFANVAAVERIIVVIAPDDRAFDDVPLDPAVKRRVDAVRCGGPTRAATVANGLASLDGFASADDWVLVHDAARCGITPSLIEALIERVQHDPVGGLLAVTLDDTVKRASDDATPFVASTVDRRGLWRAQTPQMFRYRLLVDAMAAARIGGVSITDESSAMEAAGHRVLLVPGSPRNFKVTTADDVAMMDALLRRQAGDRATDPATDRRDPATTSDSTGLR